MNQILRQKVINSIKYIGQSYYANEDNFTIKCKDNYKIETTDVTALLVLTYLAKEKLLITGPPGSGKTTSMEALSSIYDSIPVDLISSSLLRGNPQLTEEKIYGNIDLAKLKEGKRKIMWSNYALFPSNLIDEINRITEDKQSLLLDSVDRGTINYLSQRHKKNGAVYATKNGRDGGNVELLPPMINRFGAEVQTVPSTIYTGDKTLKKILVDEELSEKMFSIIEEKNSLEGILELRNEFQAKRKDLVFSMEEKKQIFDEIEEIKLDENAVFFIRYLKSESEFDPSNGYINEPALSNGTKKHTDSKVSYLFKYLGKDLMSERWCNSIENYSKVLAWLKGEDQVTVQTMKDILPYTLMHRIKEEVDQDREIDALNKVSYTKKISKEVYERFLEDLKIKESFENELNENSDLTDESEFDEKLKTFEHPYYELEKISTKKLIKKNNE